MLVGIEAVSQSAAVGYVKRMNLEIRRIDSAMLYDEVVNECGNCVEE